MYRQLMKVSKGFRLVYVGILLIILGMIGGLLGMCVAGGVAGAGAARGGLGLAAIVAGGMMLCMFIGGILGLVGRFLCLAVPEQAGPAKILIIMSVIFELTGLALTLFINAGVMVGRRMAGNAGLELQVAGMICSITSAVLFLLFTRAAAQFVRRNDLADAALLVLWLWVATIVCYGIALGVLVAGIGAGRILPLVIMLFALVIGIAALVRYINLLREMSEATEEFADRGGYRRRRRSRRKRRVEYEEDEDEAEEEDEEEDDEDRRRRSRRMDW
jgi:hypothetical protein